MLGRLAQRIPPGVRRLARLDKPERPTTIYLPQYAHLGTPYAHMVRHMDGGVFAMFAAEGAETESKGEGELAGLHERLCSLWRSIAMRTRVTITQHVVRREAEDADLPRFLTGDRLARRLDAGLRRRLLGEGRLWHNELFLGVLIRPPALRDAAEPSETARAVARDDAMALDQTLATIEADLGADYGLRRLALRHERRILFSEPAEALAMVLTGRRKRVPLCRGRLARAICPHRPVFRSDGVIELRSPGRAEYAALLGFSVYPAATDAAMFGHLLRANYRFALAQHFGTMPLHESQGLVTRTTNQFISAGDPAKKQQAELALAAEQLQQREYALGVHNVTLAVFADDERGLFRALQLADDDMRACGAIVSMIDWDIEAAYYGMLPGTEGLHCRSAPVKTRNFAAFGAMHGFPRGWRNGRWCDHVATFTTTAGIPYFWNPHVDSEGEPGESPHLLVAGPNRSGKTSLLLVLLINAIARGGAAVALWDKGRGCKLAVLRMGGEYFEFRVGEDTGLAPLKALDGTDPADMDFLIQLFRALVLSDGGSQTIPQEDERRLTLGLRLIMAMPPELRCFAQVRAFLGTSATAERLRRWCAGNELGWVLDNARDRITLSGTITGFDQTYYLDHAAACGPIQSYLFHRVLKLAGVHRLIVAIDEAWKSFQNPAFASLVFAKLRDFPKQDAALWLATHIVGDMLRVHGLADVIRSQVLSGAFFPDGAASWGDFGPDGLNVTETAFEWVKVGLLGGGRGRFLLKQGAKYTPVQLSLEGAHLEDVRAELSARSETLALMDELIAEHGLEDRDLLFDLFHERRKAPGFQRCLRRADAADLEAAE